ncbi:glycoside hydrolase family 35 protein [Anaerosporobacter faecicola]|uniref:glycoside hydrolase family 35 protein n=1 Tax=Anaerosporobacter faecicola TaxID=2718714 RepID=UPI00143A93EE|nr:beta-galactosidase family protein [Anaerosporobacter faecicola]
MSVFEIKDNFYLDNKKIQIISGGIHYFRIVPEYWRDRLEKLKALGCNTVETYIPWNLHEPVKGEFCFEGILDVERFIQIATELGLYIILRPSPYICGEWEFGGLPAWLLKEDGMRLRCSDQPYINHVKDYYQVLIPKLAKYQVTNGGNVIMMQVENEYGYYGDDKKYLETLRDLLIAFGVNVPLVTSDGPMDEAFACGKVEGVYQTGNFGSDTIGRFEFMKKKVTGPLMCMEFWVGWFDDWGSEGHHTASVEKNASDFEDMIKYGNVNIYMFVGGTNFGFMNGANYYDYLTPDVTSYDYDALLTEDGQITEKYKAFQHVLSKYIELPEVPFSTKIERKAYGTYKPRNKVGLFESLPYIGRKSESLYPVSMEKLDQSYGYILYRTVLSAQTKLKQLHLLEANDRAKIYLNQNEIATMYDLELQKGYTCNLEVQPQDSLDILMENMGRVNFGVRMERQRKGINGAVLINGHQHYNWEIYNLPMDNLDQLQYNAGYTENRPAFYQFEVDVDVVGDTFLELEGWGKGFVTVNGFNIGRFYEVGPQKNLYIPGPLLKQGKNELIIFESEGKAGEQIKLVNTPDLGPELPPVV